MTKENKLIFGGSIGLIAGLALVGPFYDKYENLTRILGVAALLISGGCGYAYYKFYTKK